MLDIWRFVRPSGISINAITHLNTFDTSCHRRIWRKVVQNRCHLVFPLLKLFCCLAVNEGCLVFCADLLAHLIRPGLSTPRDLFLVLMTLAVQKRGWLIWIDTNSQGPAWPVTQHHWVTTARLNARWGGMEIAQGCWPATLGNLTKISFYSIHEMFLFTQLQVQLRLDI